MKQKNTKKIMVSLIQASDDEMQFPLDEYEKIIYQRYIEAENQIPNFIEKGMMFEFDREGFLLVYVAGHGCSDDR